MNLDLAETTREGSEYGFPKTLAKLNSPSSALYRPSEVASAIRLEEAMSIFVVILNWLEIFLTPSEKDRCSKVILKIENLSLYCVIIAYSILPVLSGACVLIRFECFKS